MVIQRKLFCGAVLLIVSLLTLNSFARVLATHYSNGEGWRAHEDCANRLTEVSLSPLKPDEVADLHILLRRYSPRASNRNVFYFEVEFENLLPRDRELKVYPVLSSRDGFCYMPPVNVPALGKISVELIVYLREEVLGDIHNMCFRVCEGSDEKKYVNRQSDEATFGYTSKEANYSIWLSSTFDAKKIVSEFSYDPQATNTTALAFYQWPTEVETHPRDLAAYVGYDAIIMTAQEWHNLSPTRRRVLSDYVAVGGLLGLCGSVAREDLEVFDSRPAWRPSENKVSGFESKGVGFGRVVYLKELPASGAWATADRAWLLDLVRYTSDRFMRLDERDALPTCAIEVSDILPMENTSNVSGAVLVIVMGFFAMIIVPLVLIHCIYAKKNRMLVLVWLPSLSIALGIIVIVLNTVRYGFTPTLSEYVGISLDSRLKRAAVHQVQSVFTPIDVNDRVQFSRTGWFCAEERGVGDNANLPSLVREADGYHLNGVWLKPLTAVWANAWDVCETPAQLWVDEGTNGVLRVTNLLGSDILDMTLYTSQGEKVVLSSLRAGETTEAKVPTGANRSEERKSTFKANLADARLFRRPLLKGPVKYSEQMVWVQGYWQAKENAK